ncbi:MAG TPA: YjbQ family protein [Candidatus Krumholzibacteria bacterium]
MQIETTRIEIATDDGVSIADVTAEVSRFVHSCGVLDGLCVLMVGRQECFLSLAPDLDDAFDDLLRLVQETAPSPGGHGIDDRADVDTTGIVPPGVLADSLSFAVRDGAPELGSWDAIVLVDARGPARRAIEVTVMGGTRASAKT